MGRGDNLIADMNVESNIIASIYIQNIRNVCHPPTCSILYWWNNILIVVYSRGCHTFSEVGEWVLGEWKMRKKRSQ
jgi:hypothetical protein